MNLSRQSATVSKARIAVIGLGNVGLPLAIEFGKKFDILGFDVNTQRLAVGIDSRIGGKFLKTCVGFWKLLWVPILYIGESVNF